MRNKRREHDAAAAAAGALAQAREIAARTGSMPADWHREPGAILTCDDQWLQGCTWRGTEREAALIDDALCCPICGSIL